MLMSQSPNNNTQSKRQTLDSNTLFTLNLVEMEILNNSTGTFCANINTILASSDIGTAILNIIYPLLYGKILYSPNTPIYNKVIQRMNSTFVTIDQFINGNSSFDTIISYADTLKSLLQSFSSINTNLISQLNTTFNNETINDLFDQNFGFLLNQTNGNLTTLSQSLVDLSNQLSQNLTELVIVLKFIKNVLNCFELNRFYGYLNENDAVNDAMNLVDYNLLWAVVVFDDNSTTELPDKITYKIRMNAYNTHDTTKLKDKIYTYGPNNCDSCTIDFTLGFIYIQELVENSLIEERTNETYNFGVKTQMTPYPCHTKDAFIQAISKSLPLFMVLAWIFTVAMIIKDIVYEKEKRLKEFMRVMGLSNGIHWLAWFITSFVLIMFISVLLAIILKYGKVIGHTDFSVLLVFLCCFVIATITQCFLISVFFIRANLAAAAGGMIYFILYLPYGILTNYSSIIQEYQIGIASLSSTVAFGYGCQIIGSYESKGTGLDWNTFYKSPDKSQSLITMNFICLIMLIDSVIYMFLGKRNDY